MISAYDEMIDKRSILLETALKIIDWLLEKDQNNLIFKLNRLQIIKRMGTLEKEDLILLSQLSKNEQDKNILIAVHVLMGNYQIGQMYFDEMTEENKDKFRKFPIYNLLKR